MDLRSLITTNNALKFLLLGLLASFLSSCAPPPRVSTTQTELIIADASLLGKISLVGPQFQQIGLHKQAQVIAQNDTKQGISFEYRFQWMNAGGFALQEDRMWLPASVSPYNRINLTSTATSPEGEKIRLTIRRPHQEF